ncbi:MAG: hypothetical protein U0326_11775 [Polyangiales bacterium]
MLNVFIVTIAPGHDPSKLLSEETLQETQAQVMTTEEARAVGFTGIPEGAEDNIRLIAVAARDARWIQRALEGNHAVTSYRVKEIE